jgi:hypothetical protein
MLKEQGNQLMGAPGSSEKVGIHVLDYTASCGRKQLRYFLERATLDHKTHKDFWRQVYGIRILFTLEVYYISRLRLKCDGTCAETRFRLSAKGTSPFKTAGASVQSTTGSWGVHISVSNAGYTIFRGSVRVLATHSIHQFPLHFPSHASPCGITF